MTNEEAIKIINENRELFHSLGSFTKALDHASKVVENDPKKGEWIDNGQGFHFCKSCGYFALYQTHDTKTYFEKLSDCCPHCGARMENSKYG